MTLILACLTPDTVVLAADRRLTDLASGRLIDDDAAKVVVVAGQIVLAYTGLAHVKPPPRGRTDLWLVDRIEPDARDLLEIFTHIRDEASERFRLITHLGPRKKRHAFIGAGWELRAEGWSPFVGVVSNALEPNGMWRRWPSTEFNIGHFTLAANTRFATYSAGQDARAECASLERMLAHEQELAPSRIAALLTSTIRRVAERNTAVGRGVMTVVIPRQTVGAEGMVLRGPQLPEPSETEFPPSDGPTAYYLAPDSNMGTIFAPHHVTKQMKLADVQIHNRALSAEEIRQRYEQGIRERE